MKKNITTSERWHGFSIVEVMLAVALFAIFATGIITVVIGGLDNNRLSGEQLIATQYASQGLEMARNLGFSGVANSNNTFDKYTQSIGISSIDTDTKKVTSTVSWNFNSARANSVILSTYLTNWIVGIATSTPSSCNDLALSLGHTTGTCRQNINQCNISGEIHLADGDIYCTIPSADTCCALASTIPTITPTAGPTPTTGTTPTAAPTPIPTSSPTNCTQYCQATYGRAGVCARSNNCKSPKINAGRIYECTSPNYCCCQ